MIVKTNTALTFNQTGRGLFDIPPGTPGRLIVDLTKEPIDIAEFEALIRCLHRGHEQTGEPHAMVDIEGRIRVLASHALSDGIPSKSGAMACTM